VRAQVRRPPRTERINNNIMIEVKTRLQTFACKFNLYRYTAEATAVGLCTLNQVDP
jgi:hypothetical protein